MGVWKRVESGVGRGVRGIWEYDGGTPGVYGNFWEISGKFLEISEKILGIFRENSGKFPEVMGDTRGVQHDITQ